MLNIVKTAEQNHYKLVIAYDGTDFKGWQDNHRDPSIEKTLRLTLEKILQHPVTLEAASRTDAGVHAEGQVVTFSSPCLRKSPDKFILSLNALLPPSIRGLSLEEVEGTFHPTLAARGKEYHYKVCFGPVMSPHQRWTTWHTPGPLNITSMQKACELMTGTHDFAAFCNILSERQFTSTFRTLQCVELDLINMHTLNIRVMGESFLYKMVRNIAGTLVYVGRGKIDLNSVPSLLKGGKRPEAGVTAPAHGLTLVRVFY